MHELSIAEALAEQVRRHAPPGARVLRVNIQIGARQSIDEESLGLAWRAVAGGDLGESQLQVQVHSWSLLCGECRRAWSSDDPLEPCPDCRSERVEAGGGDDLILLSLEVDQYPARELLHQECAP